jgi:uncharacterized protein YfiM (DUF2279 family)
VKFALIFVLGSFQFGASPERAQDGDRWFARDKLYHLVGSAVIQGASHSMLRATGSDYRAASITAGLITLSAGVGKELWDRSQGRYLSWKDLGADVLGGGTAAIAARQWDR